MLLKLAIYAAVVIGGFILLDQLFLWLERRGRLYWRKKKRPESRGSRGPLSCFQQLVQPEIRHVQEDREQRQSVAGEQDASER